MTAALLPSEVWGGVRKREVSACVCIIYVCVAVRVAKATEAKPTGRVRYSYAENSK